MWYQVEYYLEDTRQWLSVAKRYENIEEAKAFVEQSKKEYTHKYYKIYKYKIRKMEVW